MRFAKATDADLLQASQTGQVDAFGQLVERYESLVHAVCLSTTGHPALSEDVAQETFLTAWSQLGNLREPGRFRAWLCGIARNLSLRARQKRGREVLVEQVETEAADSPLDAAIDRETEALVWSALERVPPKYREVLVLFYQEGRSAQEVGRILELSESAVHQRLSRGRRHLKTCVESTVESVLSRKKKNPSFAATIVLLLSSGAAEAAPVEPKDAGSPADQPTPSGNFTMLIKLAVGAAVLFTPIIGWQLATQTTPETPASTATETASAPTPLVLASAEPAPTQRPSLKPSVLPATTPASESPRDEGGCRPLALRGAEQRWAQGAIGDAIRPCFAGQENVPAEFELTVDGLDVKKATFVGDHALSNSNAVERCLVQALADFPIQPTGDRPARIVHEAASQCKSTPPKTVHVNVSADLPSRGPVDASVTAIVYTDPMCHYCGKLLGTLDQIRAEYPKDVRIVMKSIAISPKHDLAVEALLAAKAQGKFWPMHDVMMAHQDNLSRADLSRYAAQAGLDVSQFDADLDKHAFLSQVEAGRAKLKTLGFKGVPATVVNGEVVGGAQPIDAFRPVIRRALER